MGVSRIGIKLLLVAAALSMLLTACSAVPEAAAREKTVPGLSDLTGDGTPDLRLDNGRIWLQYHGDDAGAIVSAGAVAGEASYISPIKPRHLVNQSQVLETVSSDLLAAAGSWKDAYSIRLIMEGSGLKAQERWTLSLAPDAEYIIMQVSLKNIGSRSFDYGGAPAQLTEDTGLVHFRPTLGECMFPDRSKNDGAFVNGTGELQYSDLRGWASAPASATAPFMTLYDKISHESLTVGSISPWASPPQQFVVHNADDEWGTAGMVVAPVTIAPGKEVSWNLILAFHKGPERGAGIYQDAVSRAG